MGEHLQEAVPDGAAAVRYQPYLEYMESNIPWLNELPEHWVGTLFKRYCDIQLGKMLQPNPASDHDKKVSYLRAVNVQWEQVDTSSVHEMWASPKDIEKFIVKNGDLLVCEGGEVGRSAILKNLTGTCIIQNALHRIKGNVKTNVPFLNYLMRHIADSRWFDILCNKATIAHLTGEKLGAIDLPLPPLSEQQTIAAFLDYKTAKIDALIAKKKALLENLAEKRTALISHAVTKGLDPKTPMRDSGIDWLGEIPAHWEALPLRRLVVNVKTGSTPTGVNETHFDDTGMPWFKPGDFNNSLFLNNAEKKLSEEGVSEVRVFPSNTVMHVGIGATIGKVGVTTKEASCNQQINAIICNEKLNPLYAVYYLHSIKEFIVKCGKYTTLPIINQDETKELVFTVPPVEEQKMITQFLLHEEEQINTQQNRINVVIKKLQEYRSALITNAVTGKIDVRIFRLPEAEELVNHG